MAKIHFLQTLMLKKYFFLGFFKNVYIFKFQAASDAAKNALGGMMGLGGSFLGKNKAAPTAQKPAAAGQQQPLKPGQQQPLKPGQQQPLKPGQAGPQVS